MQDPPLHPGPTAVRSADIVVFGATPGGISAACTAAELGTRVLLLETSSHLGGHLTSGICTTECEHMLPVSFSGWMMRFMRRIGRWYGLEGALHRWEPHVASRIFEDLLEEAGVAVCKNVILRSIGCSQGRIREILLEDGSVITAAQWIDASYEGDLLSGAGVPSRIGRESRDVYGESLAGFRFINHLSEVRNSKGHAERIDTVWEIPLREETGGWVAGVSHGITTPLGSGDEKVQNYHYRVTVTKAADRIPFSCPEGYREERFTLLCRFLHAHPDTRLSQVVAFLNHPSGRYSLAADGSTIVHPQDTFELNNLQASILSMGHLGGQFGYPAGDRGTRKRILQDHYDYNAGLLYFLSHSSEVPRALREETALWGLPPGEYPDNHHWPYQPYIRETRRMIGDFVLTEKDILLEPNKPDVIFWNSHWIDCHHVQRIALDDHHFRNEGRIWHEVTQPYAVPFRALLPPRDSIDNLLVPGCLSASHVAFCSIRLESTWMGLGEAAGVGAAMALARDCAVQEVDVGTVQEALRARHVFLPQSVA